MQRRRGSGTSSSSTSSSSTSSSSTSSTNSSSSSVEVELSPLATVVVPGGLVVEARGSRPSSVLALGSVCEGHRACEPRVVRQLPRGEKRASRGSGSCEGALDATGGQAGVAQVCLPGVGSEHYAWVAGKGVGCHIASCPAWTCSYFSTCSDPEGT